MATSDPSSIPETEDPIGEQLDNEIASLKALTTSLKSHRKLQATTIISAHASISTLNRLRSSTPSTSNGPRQDIPPDSTPLLTTTSAQAAHNLENLYRACTSITTFRIRDPDPHAVDSGHILGIRIDVSTSGKFIRPYYIMLNKPWEGSPLLRVHRHTVPSCIPLASIVEVYLPVGKISSSGRDVDEEKGTGGKQDLRRFVRAVRREVVGYHNRVAVVKDLRRRFKLDESIPTRKGKARERVIVDISAADAEVQQVRIEWTDGRIGRVVVDKKGAVTKCVVMGEGGRDWEVERRLIGPGRMEGIGDALSEGIY